MTSTQRLFADATKIDAAGLSLNLLCQQYADQDLRALIEGGTNVRCLFLAPYGTSIASREREEGYPAGHLSALTEMNRQILLQRVRERLTEDARPRLQIATYDETIRFNVLLVDEELGVVQPYLSTARGRPRPRRLVVVSAQFCARYTSHTATDGASPRAFSVAVGRSASGV